MKNIQMSSDWLRVALLLSEILCPMACLALYGKQRSYCHERLFIIVMSLKRKQSVLSIKDKNEDADDIVFQMISKSIVSRLKLMSFS